MNHAKPSYSIKELERLLGLFRASLHREINVNRLKTFTVGKRRFISASALDQWVAEREAESQRSAA